MNFADTRAGGTFGPQLNSREQLLEVAVFLFLIAPSLALSFFVIDQGNVGFVLTAIVTMLRDLSLVSLILLFLWRNNESVGRLGWTLQGFRKEVLVGLLLWVPMMLGTAALAQAAEAIGFSERSTPLPSLQPSKTVLEMTLAVILVTVVALTEETIFRGYLMLRFQAIFGSSLWSVVLSAFVFSLGHGYEGTAGVITVGAMGLVFGLVYQWRKSLIAPITMHLVQDFVGIVLLPLFAGR